MELADMDDDSLPFSAGEAEEVDVGAEVLARFGASPREEHQRLCAAAGAIAQSLRDKSLPATPVAYFAAAAASLDRVSRGSLPDPAAPALLDLLSRALPRVPPAVARSRSVEVSDTLVRVLGTRSLPDWAVRAGIRCVAHLLVVGDKRSWKSVEPMFGLLLGFVTDPRSEVREQSRLSLYDVLQSFQNTPLVVLASKEIKNTLERFLLLAGGSKRVPSAEEEGPKGAAEVLYILNALRDCLPLMSMEYKNIILKFCKPLLDMRQTIVTRSIMDILQALCCSSTSEISSQDLIDLLCSIASYVDNSEKSADVMASIARLLHVGSRKVYDIDRRKCVIKLPLIFNCIGDILATEHEEATFAAMEALIGLIHVCIDESLINQGVEQIKHNPGAGMRMSGPTIIEKICATIEGFTDYRYNAVWDLSFQVLSAAFDTLGRSSFFLLAGTVKSLADMQKLSDEDFPYRKQLHECVGSAVSAMGPEAFLSILPFNFDSEDLSDANIWLLPILKQHIVGAHLSYFVHNILNMVKVVLQKSREFEKEGRTFSARTAEGLVYSLWSLLPAFCNHPMDTSSSYKILQKILCNTLHQEPELRGIICSSLQILIRQNSVEHSANSVVFNGESNNAERKAKDQYTPHVKKENLEAIKSSAPQFFAVLSDVYLTSSKDSGGCLQSTIREFAGISEKKIIRKYFSTIMGKLLKVTEESIKVGQPRSSSSMQVEGSSDQPSLSHARALLLDLAVSFLPGLDMKEIEVLYIAIKPAFQDDEGLIQKKAYKILSTILKERREFFSSKMNDILELMIAALPSFHFSAKRHRLDCLYSIIVYICEDSTEQRRDIISSFLTEIILALKESNKKTRNRAYELLVEIGHACGDEERGGKKENLQQYFQMVAKLITGETPQMISAAVTGLARLAYEFSDLISTAYNLLPSSFFLLQRKNREIVKANLGLMKVLVAKSRADGLQVHLKGIVEGLLKWQDDTKSHFKAKVKLLLEMLVRKCGLDAVKAVMPEEHMKLLTNIRKITERKERKSKSEADSESLHSKTSASRQSRWNHTRIFSDFGEDDEDYDSDEGNSGSRTLSGRQSKASHFSSSRASLRSTRKRQSAKMLLEDLFNQSEEDPLEDDPLDLLDRQRTRSALQSSARFKRKPEPSDELELDADGRLIVREDKTKPKKERSLTSDYSSDTRSQMSSRSLTSSVARTQKRRKTTESGWAYTGSEYTSKKAGGDVKKKDKFEPYAYWPLDRKLLNRRTERKVVARKGMARVMKHTKKLEGKSVSSALSSKGLKIKKKQKGSKKR